MIIGELFVRRKLLCWEATDDPKYLVDHDGVWATHIPWNMLTWFGKIIWRLTMRFGVDIIKWPY